MAAFDFSTPFHYGLPFEPTSSLACDRHQGLFSVGLKGGLIKLWNLWGLEKTIQNPIKGDVTHLQFIKNQGILAVAVSSQLTLWSINKGLIVCGPMCIPNSEEITALHAPDVEQPFGMNVDQLYIGTNQSSIYIFTLHDKTLRKYSAINSKLLFPLTAKQASVNSITAIKAHKNKPHKILVAFKTSGAIIWNMKERKYSRRITVTKLSVLDAEWAYENDSILLALDAGSVAFCSIKGKIKNDVSTLRICSEPIGKVFWVKHADTNPLLITLTDSGSN